MSLSAFDAELGRGGDLRFGPVGVKVAGSPDGGGGLEFSLAGTSGADEVDMDLAVPAAALRSVSRRSNLPDSALLTVPVRGSPPHLKVDWAAALRLAGRGGIRRGESAGSRSTKRPSLS